MPTQIQSMQRISVDPTLTKLSETHLEIFRSNTRSFLYQDKNELDRRHVKAGTLLTCQHGIKNRGIFIENHIRKRPPNRCLFTQL